MKLYIVNLFLFFVPLILCSPSSISSRFVFMGFMGITLNKLLKIYLLFNNYHNYSLII